MELTTLFQGLTLKDIKPIKPLLRKDIVEMFVNKLNSEIEDNNKHSKVKYRKMDPVFVAIKMSHLKKGELQGFFDDCKEANSFSKYWWWALKSTSVNKPFDNKSKKEYN